DAVVGERDAVDPAMIVDQRLAQLGDAPLLGVEGLATPECCCHFIADEGWRRQIALADPQADHIGDAEAELPHLDDARILHRLDVRANRRERGGSRCLERRHGWTAYLPDRPAAGNGAAATRGAGRFCVRTSRLPASTRTTPTAAIAVQW